MTCHSNENTTKESSFVLIAFLVMHIKLTFIIDVFIQMRIAITNTDPSLATVDPYNTSIIALQTHTICLKMS